MKNLTFVVATALTLGACSSIDRHKLVTEDGRHVGDIFNIRHSQDGCGWQAATVVYDPSGKLQEHKISNLPGISCAALEAGARVGGAAVFGSSLPRNVGDSTSTTVSNHQGQGQAQRQHQVASPTNNSLNEVNASVSSASGATANANGMPGGMD